MNTNRLQYDFKRDVLTPGMTTAPTPFFSFDLPLPPLPDRPAPRGLRFPGNPDPRPYSMQGNNVNATSGSFLT